MTAPVKSHWLFFANFNFNLKITSLGTVCDKNRDPLMLLTSDADVFNNGQKKGGGGILCGVSHTVLEQSA